MSKDLIHQLPIELLQPNPFQPRNKIKSEEIQELSESVALHGILEPLVVADTPAGYQIIAGERRWRAAQKAGLKTVPAILKKVSPSEMLQLAIIENVQRTDLNPLERAQAFLQLTRDFGMTPSIIAEKISKSQPYVSNTLRLLDLPDAIKDGIAGNLITEGHARALMGIGNPRDMIDAYKQLLRTTGTVRDAEVLARNWKDAQQIHQLKGVRRAITSPTDPEALVWEKKLQEIIQAKTWVNSKIQLSRSKNQTRIVITLKGSQMETEQALQNFMKLAKESSPAN